MREAERIFENTHCANGKMDGSLGPGPRQRCGVQWQGSAAISMSALVQKPRFRRRHRHGRRSHRVPLPKNTSKNFRRRISVKLQSDACGDDSWRQASARILAICNMLISQKHLVIFCLTQDVTIAGFVKHIF